MRATHGTPDPDRRTDGGLTFDPDARVLGIGSLTETVAADGGNRAVLEAYVRLTATCRGRRPSGVTQVRAADLDALAAALDLDHHDIRDEVSAILGTAAVETTRLLTRIRQRRFLAGVAAAAAGVAVVGGLAVGSVGSKPASAGTASARPAAAEAAPTPAVDATTSTSAPVGAAVTVDGPVEDLGGGVSAIPPLELDEHGVGLIPPAELHRPTP